MTLPPSANVAEVLLGVSKTWAVLIHRRKAHDPAFIRIHLALLAGTDFLTAEVLTLRGLVTYYVLFFIDLGEPPGGRRRH